jgi:Tfp pilus assembly protein PilF
MLAKALEQDNEIPEAHITLGRIYEKSGKDDLAINQYNLGIKQALKAKVGKVSLQGHFYIGCQYERRKELK